MALVVNDERIETEGPVDATLLTVLRARGLTGAKEACGRGECGACTVLVGETPTLACIQLATLVREPVRTVEGLGDAGRRVREAFAERCAHQCGYCTPGYVMTAVGLVERGEPTDRSTLRHQVCGNVCRCTGYAQILDAIEDATSGGPE